MDKEFVCIGYRNHSDRVAGFAAAKSSILLNAIQGKHPEFYIDPSLARLSCGTLPGAPDAKAFSEERETIRFTWKAYEKDGDHQYDQAMLLVYHAGS